MPQHRPIKFKSISDPNIIERVKYFLKKNKTKSFTDTTLCLIALGGFLTLTAVAPVLVGAFGYTLRQYQRVRREEYRRIWEVFNRFKKRNQLEFIENKNGHDVYTLTEEGKKKILHLIYDKTQIRLPKKWDHKWRLVIFDIPEKKRQARGALQRKLKEIGFCQCQKSVWVHPFHCFEEIEFIKDILNLKPYVKIFLIEEMTDGKVLYYFRNLLKKVITG